MYPKFFTNNTLKITFNTPKNNNQYIFSLAFPLAVLKPTAVTVPIH